MIFRILMIIRLRSMWQFAGWRFGNTDRLAAARNQVELPYLQDFSVSAQRRALPLKKIGQTLRLADGFGYENVC